MCTLRKKCQPYKSYNGVIQYNQYKCKPQHGHGKNKQIATALPRLINGQSHNLHNRRQSDDAIERQRYIHPTLRISLARQN